MGKSLLALAWAFIVGVAAYDTYFAWQHWAFFDAWEMNPLARWVAAIIGFHGLAQFQGRWPGVRARIGGVLSAAPK